MSSSPQSEDNFDLKSWFELREQRTIRAAKFLNSMSYKPLMPEYDQCTVGDWSIHHASKATLLRDYIGNITKFKDTILSKTKGEHAGVWMSLTKMELQSHIIHINSLMNVAKAANAKGEVPTIIIGGLGMGMFLLSAIFYLSQEGLEADIIVIEQSPDIVPILQQSLKGLGLELLEFSMLGLGGCTVDVVIGDIMGASPVLNADYMYVDIWQGLGSSKAAIMSKALVDTWQPKSYGYWGEEIDITAYGPSLTKSLRLACKYDSEEMLDLCKTIYCTQTEFEPNSDYLPLPF